MSKMTMEEIETSKQQYKDPVLSTYRRILNIFAYLKFHIRSHEE